MKIISQRPVEASLRLPHQDIHPGGKIDRRHLYRSKTHLCVAERGNDQSSMVSQENSYRRLLIFVRPDTKSLTALRRLSIPDFMVPI